MVQSFMSEFFLGLFNEAACRRSPHDDFKECHWECRMTRKVIVIQTTVPGKFAFCLVFSVEKNAFRDPKSKQKLFLMESFLGPFFRFHPNCRTRVLRSVLLSSSAPVGSRSASRGSFLSLIIPRFTYV